VDLHSFVPSGPEIVAATVAAILVALVVEIVRAMM
jgi:hypothetical protein